MANLAFEKCFVLSGKLFWGLSWKLVAPLNKWTLFLCKRTEWESVYWGAPYMTTILEASKNCALSNNEWQLCIFCLAMLFIFSALSELFSKMELIGWYTHTKKSRLLSLHFLALAKKSICIFLQFRRHTLCCPLSDEPWMLMQKSSEGKMIISFGFP